MKRLKFASSPPLLSHAILGVAIASTAVSFATPASGFATKALRDSFSCVTGCYTNDNLSFYVVYGKGSKNTWKHNVGAHDHSGFYANPDYDGSITTSKLNIADGVSARYNGRPNPDLDDRSGHTLTKDSQYWAGIGDNDALTWKFNSRTTGLWANFYNPTDLKFKIAGAGNFFNFNAILPSKQSGWTSVGFIAKEASFDKVIWKAKNNGYTGWDMKNLKVDVPEPLTTTLATGLALGFGALFQRSSKKQKKRTLAA
mgnify:CR=1 FL=1